MGSRVRIVVYAEEEPVASVRRAFGVIDDLERALSDYRDDSEAMRVLLREPGAWHDASPLLIDAIAKSRDAWEASGGVFDITVGPVTALWREARRTGEPPSDADQARARALVGMQHLEIDPAGHRVRFALRGMRLDFGGIGKGLGADAALSVLRDAGHPSAFVEIGGDLALGDPPPGARAWTIRATDDEGRTRTLVAANAGIATSGDAHRSLTVTAGAPLSHIVDPASALPLSPGDAVTVTARHAWIADALATIARLATPDEARAAAERLGGADFLAHDR